MKTQNLQTLPEESSNVRYDSELEKRVLGTMIAYNDCIPEVNKFIKTKQIFYQNKHRMIWDAIQYCYEQFSKVDYLLLTQSLKANRKLEIIGGAYYLTSLTTKVYNQVTIAEHCLILTTMYMLRSSEQFIETVKQDIGINYTAFNIHILLDDMKSHLNKMEHLIDSNTSSSLPMVISSEVSQICTDMAQKTKPGLSTGFEAIDRVANRMLPGDLWVIASRPGMGKTSLAFQIAVNIAEQNPDKYVDFWSLEMLAGRLVQRYMALKTGLSAKKIAYRELDTLEYESIKNIQAPKNLRIYDDSRVDIKNISNYYTAFSEKKRPQLVVFDYLQLAISKGNNQSNRERDVADISRGLKTLAMHLQIPVIALSQLSREVEKRKPPKPRLSDLRESGSIEQDADLVGFIYRPSYYEDSEQKNAPGTAELIIEKNRNGGVGSAVLKFTPKTTEFTETKELDEQYNEDLFKGDTF